MKAICPLVVAVSVAAAVSSFAVNAGTTASISASNLYLFRGLNFSGSAPQVAGSLDYAHDTGLYAGIWASSESTSGQEYDLYAGYKGEYNGFGYDASVIDYNYPDSTAASGNEDIGDRSELVLGFSAGPASLKIVDSLQGDASSDPDSAGSYQYYALSYNTDMLGVTLGIWDLDTNALFKASGVAIDGGDTMTHLDVSYFATDELTFTASQVVDNPEDDANVQAFNDDTLFVATYTKKFDL